jgi:hypothetical protein
MRLKFAVMESCMSDEAAMMSYLYLEERKARAKKLCGYRRIVRNSRGKFHQQSNVSARFHETNISPWTRMRRKVGR